MCFHRTTAKQSNIAGKEKAISKEGIYFLHLLVSIG